MNDWANIMGRRDRLAALLRPHLGKAGARERANDIMQALLCADEEPTDVALRMLARDLDARAAQIVAFQVGRAWEAPRPAPVRRPPPENTVSAGQVLARVSVVRDARAHRPRPRRETVILGLWN